MKPLLVTAMILVTGCVREGIGDGDPSATGAVLKPTASQELPFEIAAAIERRKEFGLRADPEYVAMVADDPSAVMSDFGMLLLPAEVAELDRRMRAQEHLGALQGYGAGFADTFGGMYVDQAAGGTVVLLFTEDVARHARAAAALAPPGVKVHVRYCRYSEAELVAFLDSLDFAALALEGYEVISGSVDTISNVVTIDAKSNLPDAEARLEARYGGIVQANIHPAPGPWQNAQVGDGWRLVTFGHVTADEAYTVRAAVNAAEWRALWNEVGLAGEAPAVDMGAEIAVSFGFGVGSTCNELRLDGVVIDRAHRLVHAVTSDPLGPRACTTDLAGATVFVVALAGESLPPSPFTLRLGPQLMTCGVECGSAEEIAVTLDP